MSWTEHRIKIKTMSNKEIIERVLQSEISADEVKQIARDELLIRLIEEVTKLKKKLS